MRPPRNRRLVWAGLATLVLAVGAVVGLSSAVHATPPSGLTLELLSRGTVARAITVHAAGTELETRGPVDLATAHITFQPGGSTGWHVHPGPALITVKTGTVTLYTRDCRAHPYAAGQAFVERGPDFNSMVRNNGSTTAETVVTFILPVGAPLLVSQPAPPHCNP